YDGRYWNYDAYLADPYYYDSAQRYVSYTYVSDYVPGVDDLDDYGDWQVPKQLWLLLASASVQRLGSLSGLILVNGMSIRLYVDFLRAMGLRSLPLRPLDLRVEWMVLGS